MSKISAIACLDAAYSDRAAAVAGVLIHAWDAQDPSQILVRRFDSPFAAYEPGAFFKRELPLLLSIIAEFDEPLQAITVDGYVWLDASGQPGRGGHLFASLGCRIPII